MKKSISSALVTATLLCIAPMSALAMGGASGATLDFVIDGKLGPVIVNPYKIAPLTAIITDGGYEIKDAHVKIVPKEGGQVIEYDVRSPLLKQHAGIPVFGLYADYYNTVEVKYTRIFAAKEEAISETYKIYAPAIYVASGGGKSQEAGLFKEVKITVKPADKFKNRLYFVNNMTQNTSPITKRFVWNNPMGGALEWNYDPQNFIIDTTGEVRWYMQAESIYDPTNPYTAGVMMGFQQNNDGAYTWGFGQRYVKYDVMGREIFNRRLPMGYIDYSHSLDVAENGHYFLRVANGDYKRADGKNVRTVRDVILEVDRDGNVVDDFRLYKILDQYRDTVLKVLDQGAVCLNLDASLAGHTLSEEDLAKMDSSDHFGDITGTSAGRNWAHVNSVDYDPSDDSIIISSRHQDAIVKIGRDKKIKWILGASAGWKDEYKKYLLTPVDGKGNKIKCDDNGVCENNFDFTWTQHTAFRIDEKSKKGEFWLSAFDNGDTRGMEQPAIASMKYSRAVIYKIDEKKMTVSQIWEYGKERGSEWYSPVTSSVKYQPDLDSVVTYSATAGLNFDLSSGTSLSGSSPTLSEFEWGAKEPSFELKFVGSGDGYQAYPFSIKKAFE